MISCNHEAFIFLQLGAKKGGLGAQRVKTNFDDIEREAQIADEQKVRAEEDAKKSAQIKEEEEETQVCYIEKIVTQRVGNLMSYVC